MITWLLPLRTHWRRLATASLLAGSLAAGLSYLIPKTYKASTTFMVPQASDAGALAALASLGALTGMTAGLSDSGSTAEQYVSLMRSNAVEDRIIRRFELLKVYDSDYQFQAREDLENNTAITVGKKDNFVTIDVQDHDAKRAADMANAYVDELRQLSNSLSLTEAQKRRVFFEQQLREAGGRLTHAQQALQRSTYSADVIRVAPEASAQGYSALKAQVTAAEITLQSMRTALADTSSEVRQQSAKLEGLRKALRQMEESGDLTQVDDGEGYISLYREFKYQETLYDLMAKQYELAKADEAREGVLIQVIDAATTPEYKHKPKRALLAALAAMLVFVGYAIVIVARSAPHDKVI